MWIRRCRWVLNSDGPVHTNLSETVPIRLIQTICPITATTAFNFRLGSILAAPLLLTTQGIPALPSHLLHHSITHIVIAPCLLRTNYESSSTFSYPSLDSCDNRLSTIDVYRYRIRQGRTRVSRITIDALFGSISVHFSGTTAAFVGLVN